MPRKAFCKSNLRSFSLLHISNCRSSYSNFARWLVDWLSWHVLTDVLFNLIWQFHKNHDIQSLAHCIYVFAVFITSAMFCSNNEISNCHPISQNDTLMCLYKYMCSLRAESHRMLRQVSILSENDIICHCLWNHNSSWYFFFSLHLYLSLCVIYRIISKLCVCSDFFF